MTINFKQFAEALKGGQKKLDANKNGKLDADDFKKIRGEEVELEEAADLHPDAQKVLKHIKPEHHAKYTPDLTKKHYTGSYADRSAVLSAAERAGHLKEETLDEAIDAEHYRATSEPSQFGGHRPKVVHKGKGTTMHLGQNRYKTKEAAKAGAAAYLNAYEKIGDKAASRASWEHAKNHPDHIKEETVKMSYSQLLNSLAEAKKMNDDDKEQGEEKLEYRADRKADKLGRMRPRNLKGIKVHDGDEDGERLGEEFELDEGEVIKTSTGVRHKGTYGSEYETDREGNEKKKAPVSAEKRGRGRPKKGSDASGEVKKYTFNSLLNNLSKRTK